MRIPAPSRRRAGAVAAALALILVGCSPPDRPAAASGPPPGPAVRLLRPDTVRTVRVVPGVVYRYLWSSRGPWAVHALEVEAGRCDVGLSVVRAPGTPGSDAARKGVSELVRRASGGAVAAVNGDFFTPEGVPRGPELSAAGFRSPEARPVFFWDPRRGPWIGTARVVRDSLVEAGGRLADDDGAATGGAMLSGFPELLDAGRRVGDLEVEERPSFAAVRHPRTVVGFDDDGGRLWVVVVDGRRASYSAGMTLPEVTDLLVALGVEEALNLDGGGSSVMVLGDRAVSRPSEEGGERPVVNALVVRSDPAPCHRSGDAAAGGASGGRGPDPVF